MKKKNSQLTLGCESLFFKFGDFIKRAFKYFTQSVKSKSVYVSVFSQTVKLSCTEAVIFD